VGSVRGDRIAIFPLAPPQCGNQTGGHHVAWGKPVSLSLGLLGLSAAGGFQLATVPTRPDADRRRSCRRGTIRAACDRWRTGSRRRSGAPTTRARRTSSRLRRSAGGGS
jgi:hypothetical protein